MIGGTNNKEVLTMDSKTRKHLEAILDACNDDDLVKVGTLLQKRGVFVPNSF
jgi:hypothetical protein